MRSTIQKFYSWIVAASDKSHVHFLLSDWKKADSSDP